MRTTIKAFEAAASKRVGSPTFDQTWPVFEEYALTETEDDIVLDAVLKPLRPTRRYADGTEVFTVPNIFEDREQRAVRHRVVPATQHKHLFLEFARCLPRRTVAKDEALEIMRSWVSEYGVLGTANVGGGQNPRMRESLQNFVKEAFRAAEVLSLYEAAIASEPNAQELGEVLRFWGHGIDANNHTANEQREYALKIAADCVGQIVKDECYPQLCQEVNRARNKTRGFTYDLAFRSLLGAMYLQMMLLLTDANNVRQCRRPGCQSIIPSYARSDKKTCSDACRKWLSGNDY